MYSFGGGVYMVKGNGIPGPANDTLEIGLTYR